MGEVRRTSIGGQALIEGVMMRGPREVAIVVRKPDQQLTVKKQAVSGIVAKYKLNKIPLLRGAVALIDSMVLGMSSLTYSAEIVEAGIEDEEPGKFERFMEKVFKDKAGDVLLYISVAIAIMVSVGVFIIAPTFITSFLGRYITHNFALNLVEGLLRLGMFLTYIVLISKMKDIQRVFQYHGAEHKAIFCYEHGEELTVENARKYTTLHPRCGTNFLFIVMMVSILLFSTMGWPNPVVRMVTRLALMPVVAGVSYEIIKLGGRSNSPIMKLVNYPGLMLQKLTTLEPDDGQLEVAIEALKNVLVDNEEEIKW
ncbi:DUF1385 domain-containing protein [Clostridium formicaceticum]|uniref:DUF1385 domain-containing protein n=1 Tax=Clostridium formicaceticum TaxID=1497 RepID=A0AAC9RFN0_9CLOT|nr:DUF1385 domain-containing protein [Clostridium formicaceticum]AOY75566.1 hypothetical protein BJL90_06450 [Clostridium formicaceticum]ARE85866.1 hypothetical protein CLFO_01820 [Clostridium formicaceticum]